MQSVSIPVLPSEQSRDAIQSSSHNRASMSSCELLLRDRLYYGPEGGHCDHREAKTGPPGRSA